VLDTLKQNKVIKYPSQIFPPRSKEIQKITMILEHTDEEYKGRLLDVKRILEQRMGTEVLMEQCKFFVYGWMLNERDINALILKLENKEIALRESEQFVPRTLQLKDSDITDNGCISSEESREVCGHWGIKDEKVYITLEKPSAELSAEGFPWNESVALRTEVLSVRTRRSRVARVSKPTEPAESEKKITAEFSSLKDKLLHRH
jgi:hypothetical protein